MGTVLYEHILLLQVPPNMIRFQYYFTDLVNNIVSFLTIKTTQPTNIFKLWAL